MDRRTLLRRLAELGLIGATVPALTGCRILAARSSDRYTVTMTREYQFEPATLTVSVGSTVVWDNQSERRHAVTTDPEGLEGTPQIVLPDNVAPFTSPDLSAGETWRLRFTEPGTYVYVCPYHHADNMIGAIIVEDA